LSINTISNAGVAGTLGMATSDASNLVFDGDSKLLYTGSSDGSTDRNFTINDGVTATIAVQTDGVNLTMSGASTEGTGNLNKMGGGTLTLSGSNLHTGLTTVLEGTLAYAKSDALSTGPITVDGNTAVLSLGGYSDQAATVTLAGGGTITGTTGVLSSTGTFEMQNGTVSGILGGSSALNKTTADTVTLTRSNTYTGNTTINEGKLTLGVDGSFNNSPIITVGDAGSSGAILDVTAKSHLEIGVGQELKGIGTIEGNVFVTGTHSPGNSPGVQTVTEDLTYSGSSIFNWELSTNSADQGDGTTTPYIFDQVIVGGNLVIGADAIFNILLDSTGSNVKFSDPFWDETHQWKVFDVAVGKTNLDNFLNITVSNDIDGNPYTSAPPPAMWPSGGFTYSGGNVYWNPVPEPSSALAGLLLGAGLLRRRRK
jgi:autotransporter-associated beta strand protein